ncbi:SnoaL-like domain-containing protein [Parasphingorhabdus marina DSM 22363]|uniref:SnoaL-like domain-containing protein n=1 Tax=Parasphingorhabdus marina DSM 22363 TaxID=1123272 RepID=A0A1N6D302_9SPHN|nr:nuclear transport factor 2 family protein [Parasphingorhabdus marina]SIN65171.1 SnoaL-like domain-containing protein [Parasphingorhabdus marina DSM 22363]
MSNIELLAHDFSALIRSGKAIIAAEKYWASDIVSIEPEATTEHAPAIVTGFYAAREKLTGWLSHSAMEELSIDGPFITGNRFALFIDMLIKRRATGECQPFSEIAIYTVRDGKIIEERYFYD